MPKIIFIEHNGTEHSVEADVGCSIMQAAVDNNVPGILGDCGGCCSCATCHGYIAPAFLARLPKKSDTEDMVLESAQEVRNNSRLTCQIMINDDLDGLIIRLPASQF